ncbi:unnamed protein product [Adineta steineri]|uniref:Uncharacterized protein n=1 Tax=Adineta steineri TaxID=433720 RepID=A0A814HZF3_9BILA|nr:unnamed protein product [Adineta steineri]CAF1267129.1 unnamed protein product [Adineta steineri]
MLDKKLKSDSTHLAIKLTCYILLECVRGSSYICLDWREVCDGRVDCLNGGVDELQCFDLEINECDENEYRCHNGLCIPEYFWTYESAIAVCADLSDTSIVPRCPLSYIGFDIFECEEYSCQPGQKMFSCGDGQCAEDFGECYSGRHILLTDSMSAQGNLSFDCWRSMVCLSKVNDQINGTSCEQLFNSSQIITHLESCETLVQFPTIPVLYGHVYFLYRPRNIFNVSITLARTPDYVCYDERLCDFLTPSFRNGTYTCRHGHEMGFEFNVEYQDWKSIIDSVKPYFRGCMAISRNRNYSQHLSLYSCKNSSKLISKHRIVDGISDCYLNDDEQEFELSCSLNDTFRFKCSDENQCLSPLFPRTRCTPSKTHHNLNEILFHTICDRTVDVSLMTIDGQNHTDETDCENWQCNNIYTRCDGVWNCLDGEDEVNCTRPICPPHSFACISPLNYTLICLPASQIYNEIIDCLGASDESQYCRTVDFNIGISYGFYCLNRCLSHSALCNSYQDCPLNDDEKFCENHQGLCENTAACNRTLIQDVLCQIGLLDRVPFTLETIPTYPQVEKRIIHHFRDYRVESRTIANDIKSQLDVSRRSQRCNHGVDLYIWLGGTDYGKICFCPANYYGDMCQYQNQRVSLTLTLIATNPDDNLRASIKL